MKKYHGNELSYIEKVLSQKEGPAGTWVQSLEGGFASKFNAKYAIAMNSGTATLHAALLALGVRNGDEVITPALSVIMDTTAILHANALPVYADIDPDTFLIDPEDVKRKITPKTKAIIVVSLYGLPLEMKAFNEISENYGIPIIEDHAQCFLSSCHGNLTSVSNAFASWSFESTKHMSCGEGGVLLTNDENYATLARKHGGHGYKNLTADGGVIKFGNKRTVQDPSYKRHDTLGWNYRMPEFNAAIALAQLENLESAVERRKNVANLFLEAMLSSPFIVPQHVPSTCVHSFFSLACRWEHPAVTWYEFRDKYIDLGGDGFYAAWSIPYREPLMKDKRYRGECPIAEKTQPKLLQMKTNYRCLETAKKQASLLHKTLDFFK